MGAVGVVIRDPRGDAVAGVAVTALLDRIEPHVAEVARLVQETAGGIAAELP